MRLWISLCFLLLTAACEIPGRDEYNRGVSAWDAGDYARAEALFQDAIQKNSDLGEAYQGLAECYVREQKLKEARDAYQKAKAIFDAGKFNDTAVEDDRKKKRVEEQLDWLNKAIELDEEANAKAASAPASTPAPAPK